MLRSLCVLLLGLVACTRAGAGKSLMEGYIVGGDYAFIEKHPHSVFLKVKCVYNNGKKVDWFCGASILNQRTLLTAAHCLVGCNSKSLIGINVGHEHKNRGQSFSTYSFLIHEKYNPLTMAYDISLIKVDGALKLGKKTGRVALMRKPPYNELATVAGWGSYDETRKPSARLKFITQRVIERNDCIKILGQLPEGTLCATADNKGDYAAQGDSGSALVVRGYIEIGLVSYKLHFKSKNIVVYTDVGHYYSWIKRQSRRIYCDSINTN